MSGSGLQTEANLTADLSALGLADGMVLTVHSSLSAIGWVDGGAATVVRSLLSVLGDAGTLAMPAATPQLLATGVQPEERPVFARETTPTALGAIPECFRTWPGTVRSDHPIESVCARGPRASEITARHPLAFSEGEGSPFARLHELDSRILLLGVGFNRCTALHFAESLVESRRVMQVRFPILANGRHVVVEHPNVADDNDTHFPVVGRRYVAAGRTRQGSIGDAPATLCSMRDLVEFARDYFSTTL